MTKEKRLRFAVMCSRDLLFGYIYADFSSRFNDQLDCKPIVNRVELLPLYREMYPDCERTDSDLMDSLSDMADNNDFRKLIQQGFGFKALRVLPFDYIRI